MKALAPLPTAPPCLGGRLTRGLPAKGPAFALTTLLLAALLLAACARDAVPPKAPLPVAVQPVAALAVPAGDQSALANRYTAVLAPRELVSLAFKVPGYVDEIDPKALDKGSRVTRGQVLARLRENDYKARVAQARSTLEEARASLVLAVNDQERNARLYRDKVISRGEQDRTDERKGVAQARVAQAAAALEQAEINLRDASLASPMDGLVVRRDVERGSLVNQGGVAFVLADLSSVKAVFGLPDQDVARISPGSPLAVTTEALPGREFTGTVSAVSPSADPKSRAFDVEVTIPNPERLLRDGMVVSVRQGAAGARDSLAAVPLHALAKPLGGDSFLVHVLAEKDGRAYAQARGVEVAGVKGDMVTVRSGLVPGERVITRGATLAADGQEVRVIR
ncbi:Efflux pump periplasmic linker BepF [Fundidesulfovibrio magnetotacticus]|uniref:Efflux pump periplasmic linker BepF n=1 Tax=Fundidesulfovibrio magnetotacticus TaxID=2730080 RepID=A0A6V8LQD3_9BACT|nr:efflux RND transporter periplasmic adaptor subunit [Fundidesulfovibrio magnetotacticus]GFK94742.1 Efflux pump periplasmic linker BepF [Fundidesulfovibrio magnetotacticus]